MSTTILKLKEKHGSRYFISNDNNEKHLIALRIIKERAKLGYFYPKTEDILENYEKQLESLNAHNTSTQISDEDLSNLPEDFRKDIERKQKMYHQGLQNINKDRDKELIYSENIEKLVSLTEDEAIALTYKNQFDREINLAWAILSMRTVFEYEDFEIIKPENI